MPFVKSLIGKKLCLNQDNSVISRSKVCNGVINSNTIVFYPHLITQGTILGFTCKLNFANCGFGKIGLSALSPHEMAVPEATLTSLLGEGDDLQAKFSVMELPKFDCDSGSLIHDWGSDKIDPVIVYLLIVCGNNGRVSVFANFTLLGKLQVASSLKSGGVAIFFDLSGPLISVAEVEDPYCVGSVEMFDSEQAWVTYCRELASYGGTLIHGNKLGVFLASSWPHSSSTDSNTITTTTIIDRILDDLHIKPHSEKDHIRRKNITINRDAESGKVKPRLESWARSTLQQCQNGSLSTIVSQDSNDSESQQQYIDDFGIKQRENTDLQSINGKSDSETYGIVEFLEAEIQAIQEMITIRDSIPNDKKTTSSDTQDFSNLQSKETNHASPRDPQKLLVHKLIDYFFQSHSSNKLDSVSKNRDYSIGDSINGNNTRSQISIKYPEESILSMDVCFYNSVCQYEIMMTIGLVSHGPFLIIEFIQQFVKDPSDENLHKLSNTVEKLCLLMTQRAAESFIEKSLLFLCVYDQQSLQDQLGTEKFYKNLNVVKNTIEEVCYRAEFKEMMFQNPVYLNQSSGGYSNEMYEVCGSVCQSLVENAVGYFVPQRWTRILKATRSMKRPGAKLLSMSQSCQLAADHGLNTIMEVGACLSWLDTCQFIHWCPRGNMDKSIVKDFHQDRTHRHSVQLNKSNHQTQNSQSRILVLDSNWVSQIIEALERESRTRFANKQDDPAFPSSLEILDVISKPFAYHKPLLLNLLRQSGLVSDSGLELCPVVCALDFPLSFDRVPSNSDTDRKPNSKTKNNEGSNNKSLVWFLQFSAEPPWLCMLAVLIRTLGMCDTNHHHHHNTTTSSSSSSSDISGCTVHYRQCSVSLDFLDRASLHVAVHNPSQLKVCLTYPPSLAEHSNLQLGSIQTYLEQQCHIQISRSPLYKLGIMSGVECPCTHDNKTGILGKVVAKKNHHDSTTKSPRHILKLNEVLYSKAVFCGEGGNRLRVSTEPWRSLFLMSSPSSISPLVSAPSPAKSLVISDPIIIEKVLNGSIGQYISNTNHSAIPAWLKKLAKMLSHHDTNESATVTNHGDHKSDFVWSELAEILGYRESQGVARFSRSSQPALCMLLDWVVSSGNCALSVEFLSIVLQEAGQYTIADFIDSHFQEPGADEDDEEGDDTKPGDKVQVFVSYQWHSRAEARAIADFLALHGVSVWMDIGPTISLTHATGTHLLHRIERALRRCQVLIACITPRYIVSPFSHRELVLTELLGKPIVPVMLSRVPWPPPGGSGLLLAPYVYIDLYGVGGHGGSGKNADVNARMFEILAQISKYIDIPLPDPQILKPNHDNLGIEVLQSKLSQSHASTDFESSSHLSMSQQQQNYLSESSSRINQSNAAVRRAPMNQTGPINNRQIPSRVSVRECSSVCTFI